MLVLAVHTVADQTAKVPFSAVLLKEMATSGERMPAELRMRQLLPTSGPVFTSLWDAPSAEAVQVWLERNVNVNVTHRAFEVHEAFALGLGDVARQRAGDQLAAGATAVGTQVKSAAKDIDDRLHLSEKTAGAVEAVRESGVGRGFETARQRAVTAAHRVAESERYQAAAAVAQNQVKKFQNTFSSWKDRAFRRDSAQQQQQQQQQRDQATYAPLHDDAGAFGSSGAGTAGHDDWGAPLGAAAAPAEHYAPVTLSSPPVSYTDSSAAAATKAAPVAAPTSPGSPPPLQAAEPEAPKATKAPAAQSSTGASFSLVDDEP